MLDDELLNLIVCDDVDDCPILEIFLKEDLLYLIESHVFNDFVSQSLELLL